MNDDTLILYYYGDGLEADERAAVDTALENDPALRQRYGALRRSLDGLGEPSTPGASAHMAARWHRAVDRAAAAERGRSPASGRGWHFPSFAWGALAAMLVLAAGVRLWFADTPSSTMPFPRKEMVADEPSSPPAAVPVAFSRGLKVHLDESRQELMHLQSDGNDDRRMLLRDIMRQNRQFERAALDNNAADVARVLRAFEPILERLANEDLSPEDAAALKAKLVFELNVMLTKIAAAESQDTQSI
jgi:hypothetical protein